MIKFPIAGDDMKDRRKKHGFTIVELLVVIGIISVLIGILMPALRRAREAAKSVQCKSNLHDLGIHLRIYETENRGWFIPVGPVPLGEKTASTLGTNVAPHERWPMKVYKIAGLKLDPLPYDPATYQDDDDPNTFSAEPFTPKTLYCPADDRPNEFHSYVLNKHLVVNQIKAGRKDLGGLTPSDVIVAGEKVTGERDYYISRTDDNDPAATTEFDRVAEKYRHGLKLGSNYLHMDGSVDTRLPNQALTGIDPWDLRRKDPSTQPTSP